MVKESEEDHGIDFKVERDRETCRCLKIHSTLFRPDDKKNGAVPSSSIPSSTAARHQIDHHAREGVMLRWRQTPLVSSSVLLVHVSSLVPLLQHLSSTRGHQPHVSSLVLQLPHLSSTRGHRLHVSSWVLLARVSSLVLLVHAASWVHLAHAASLVLRLQHLSSTRGHRL